MSQRRAKVASVISEIEPQRSLNSSIIGKIESPDLPQAPFNPDPVEAPTVALSDVTQPPRFLSKVAPKYPSLARRAQKEGTVLLEASIGIDGMAQEIQVAAGIGYGCDEAAVAALKASRFAPAMQENKEVIVRIKIPYRFSLAD